MAGGVWGLCDPNNPKNERTRPSILVEKNGQSLMIDIGPDFRLQTLRAKVIPEAILITHGHWDHIAGIGELPYYMEEVLKRDLNVYADERSMFSIRSMFPYLFFNEESKGSTSIIHFGERRQYRIFWNRMSAFEAFTSNVIEIVPFSQHHGGSDSLGVRIGNFVYSPDVKSFPEESWQFLTKIDPWILDCDYWKPSESHGDPETVLKHFNQFKPKSVFLTHMDEKMDYLVLKTWFVDHGYHQIAPAYDGMEIDLISDKGVTALVAQLLKSEKQPACIYPPFFLICCVNRQT
ncbi:MBL fold metallo-hydrolase [Brucella intermedia]|uniref:MBL fold metallo-hydrolase n=1 Tax=Brucella intermedia TaxID=94625 RepID=UPI0012D30F57|nr:MBL fold metallo-hydrolase [Brucella intermedia]